MRFGFGAFGSRMFLFPTTAPVFSHVHVSFADIFFFPSSRCSHAAAKILEKDPFFQTQMCAYCLRSYCIFVVVVVVDVNVEYFYIYTLFFAACE